jgi:hypothetical protein
MLKLDRSTWDTHWRELGDVFNPRRYGKPLYEANKGRKKNEKILNPIGQLAIRTLAAGMMSGITSPSRPWMRLTLADETLADQVEAAEVWLYETTQRMLAQLARTNFYNVASASTYPDLATWGTHATMVLKDPKTLLRFYPLQIGEYYLASSFRGEIDTAYREFVLTVGALVEEFGYDQCTTRVQQFWDQGKYDVRIPVLHAVEPNRDHDPRRGDWRGKAWTAVWLESSTPEDKKAGLLRKSGHSRFPGLTPRWTVDGQDVYGRSPGMDALPTAKQLQKLEYRLALEVALISQPPQSAPASIGDEGGVNSSPGGVTYRPSSGNPAADKIEPIVDTAAIASAIQHTEHAIERREKRVREFFFSDFWLAILNDERTTPATAEEVRAKKEERMLQLGPVLEQIQTEFLEPLVEMLFDAMLEAGLIDPPPQELVDAARQKGQGSIVFEVEYVSIAAAAQRALGLTSVRSFLEVVAQGQQFDPQALDNVDVDVLVQDAARILGVNPKIVKAMDVVKQLRAARAQQQHAQEQGQAMLAATQGAKNLGTTPAPSPDNALGNVLASMGPQASQLLPAPTNQMP